MQFLDDVLGERLFRMVYHIINGTKMVDCFDDVIDRDPFSDINRVRFKNQSGLNLTELLDKSRVVS